MILFMREELRILGNGNIDAGRRLVIMMAMRVLEARVKHPVFAEGAAHALGVIEEEDQEFSHAILHESVERQIDELLDKFAVGVRFYNGEHLALTEGEGWHD